MDEDAALGALQAKLGQLGIGGDKEEGGSQPPKVLGELTLEGVVKHIQKLMISDNSELHLSRKSTAYHSPPHCIFVLQGVRYW